MKPRIAVISTWFSLRKNLRLKSTRSSWTQPMKFTKSSIIGGRLPRNVRRTRSRRSWQRLPSWKRTSIRLTTVSKDLRGFKVQRAVASLSHQERFPQAVTFSKVLWLTRKLPLQAKEINNRPRKRKTQDMHKSDWLIHSLRIVQTKSSLWSRLPLTRHRFLRTQPKS